MDKKNRILIASSFLRNKKIFIGLPLFLIVVGVVFVALVRFGIIKDPFPLKNIPILQKQKEPRVSIKTEYKNPFDKKTQYVNPFETYKNPFVVAK